MDLGAGGENRAVELPAVPGPVAVPGLPGDVQASLGKDSPADGSRFTSSGNRV